MAKLLEIGGTGFLSYGNIKIDLSKDGLVQLLGINGVGKTNIISLLTEALFSKNPRGYAKTDLLNRNGKYQKSTIYAKFADNSGNEYVATTVRTKTTAKVTLTKNGVDVSGHTSKQTFDLIQSILGMDYELFLQYTYQSSRFPTEFLLATPKARRDYLANLLDLDAITSDVETVSNKIKELKNEVTFADAKLAKLGASLSSLGTRIPVDKDVEVLQRALSDLRTELLEVTKQEEVAKYAASRFNVASAKLATAKTELDKQMRNAPTKLSAKVVPQCEYTLADLFDTKELSDSLVRAEQEYKRIKTGSIGCAAKLNSLKNSMPDAKCRTCGHELDNQLAIKLLEDSIVAEEATLVRMGETLDRLTAESTVIKNQLTHWQGHNAKVRRVLQEVEAANTYNCNIEAKFEAANSQYTKFITSLDLAVANAQEEYDAAEAEYNHIVTPSRSAASIMHEVNELELAISGQAHAVSVNAKIDVAEAEYNEVLASKTEAVNTLEVAEVLQKSLKLVLTKTIESGIKTIEVYTNKYLADFSSKAYLKFNIVGDKIEVNVLYEGNEVSINTLSTGQFSRVSISTLFALRELLNKRNPLNFLMLDEVVGVLDSDGKESLVDILLNTRGLKVFLVSHEWQHPLLEKLQVTHRNGESSIEEVS